MELHVRCVILTGMDLPCSNDGPLRSLFLLVARACRARTRSVPALVQPPLLVRLVSSQCGELASPLRHPLGSHGSLPMTVQTQVGAGVIDDVESTRGRTGPRRVSLSLFRGLGGFGTHSVGLVRRRNDAPWLQRSPHSWPVASRRRAFIPVPPPPPPPRFTGSSDGPHASGISNLTL